MKIYLEGKYSSGKTLKIQLPVIPETITCSMEGRFSEYEILNLGQVNVPNGKNLKSISFESFFPGSHLKNQPYVQKWQRPIYLDHVMKYWLSHGTEIALSITGTKLNLEVYLSEYSSDIKYKGDYYYTVTFEEARELTVKKKRKSKKSSSRKRVTVKKGDSLKKLAKKYLGSRKKYKQIYKANKKLIDARNKKAKKKSGNKKISKYKIYKGQVLVIPKTKTKTVKNDKVQALKKALKSDGYGKFKVDKKLTTSTKTAMKKVKLRTGKTGDVVKLVQKTLGVSQTGKYDKKTQAAVKRYQRKKGLKVNGVVSYDTLLKMVS